MKRGEMEDPPVRKSEEEQRSIEEKEFNGLREVEESNPEMGGKTVLPPLVSVAETANVNSKKGDYGKVDFGGSFMNLGQDGLKPSTVAFCQRTEGSANPSSPIAVVGLSREEMAEPQTNSAFVLPGEKESESFQ